MSAVNRMNLKQVITCWLGTVSTAGDYCLSYLPQNFVLTGAKILDQNGIAASDTNYVTLTLKNGTTSLGSYDSRTANQGAATALVAKAFAMTSATQDVAAGSSLKMTYAEGGTGTTTLAQIVLEGYLK